MNVKFVPVLLTGMMLLLPSKSQAQTSEEIETRIFQYFQNIIDKDYDTFYGLLAPNFRRYIPKDSVMNMLFMVNNDDRYINQIVDFRLGEISDPVVYDNIIYVKLDYSAERHLIYTSEASDDFIKNANAKFEKIHAGNFEYIESERKIITFSPASVILCIDTDNPDWYFTPYLPKLRPTCIYLYRRKQLTNYRNKNTLKSLRSNSAVHFDEVLIHYTNSNSPIPRQQYKKFQTSIALDKAFRSI